MLSEQIGATQNVIQGAFFLRFSEKVLDKKVKIGQAALKAFLRRATDEKLPEIY